jgi:nucleoside phosphorylase
MLLQSDKKAIDVVVIFALKEPEMDMFLEATSIQYIDDVQNGIVFRIASLEINGKLIQLAFAVQREMGMVSAAILTTTALISYNPRLVIMGGICAGVQGKVNIGDLIIANPAFNYESGKHRDGNFDALFIQRTLDRSVSDLCNAMKDDTAVIQKIRDSWKLKTGRPETEMQIHIAPVGTGSSVVADEAVVKALAHYQRNLTGIDMEAYGVAQSAFECLRKETPWLVVKGVQDHADTNKNNKSREYAAWVSAVFIVEFLTRYFSIS